MTEDVIVRKNIVRNVGVGVGIQGDDGSSSHNGQGLVRRITIRDNLFYDIKTANGVGRAFNVPHGPVDVTIDHNTAIHNGQTYLVAAYHDLEGTVFTNNLTAHGRYGVVGDSTGTGNVSLNTWFPGIVFQKNVLIETWGYTTNQMLNFYSQYTGGWSPAIRSSWRQS